MEMGHTVCLALEGILGQAGLKGSMVHVCLCVFLCFMSGVVQGFGGVEGG